MLICFQMTKKETACPTVPAYNYGQMLDLKVMVDIYLNYLRNY